MLKPLKHLHDVENCMRVDVMHGCIKEIIQTTTSQDPLKACQIGTPNSESPNIIECVNKVEASTPIFIKRPFEELRTSKRQPEKPSELELKPLSIYLKYAFLGDLSTLPVIVSSSLNME